MDLAKPTMPKKKVEISLDVWLTIACYLDLCTKLKLKETSSGFDILIDDNFEERFRIFQEKAFVKFIQNIKHYFFGCLNSNEFQLINYIRTIQILSKRAKLLVIYPEKMNVEHFCDSIFYDTGKEKFVRIFLNVPFNMAAAYIENAIPHKIKNNQNEIFERSFFEWEKILKENTKKLFQILNDERKIEYSLIKTYDFDNLTSAFYTNQEELWKNTKVKYQNKITQFCPTGPIITFI